MRSVVKFFKEHSVSVSGKKGTGKDLLMANVIARRKSYYISNVNYKCFGSGYISLDFEKLKTGNVYKNFLTNKIKKYIYPYPDGTDIYISDCGIYFPCQYNDRLNREFEDIISFIALSRQLGDCRVHTNSQFIGRVWDKLREQQDVFLVCQSAKVFFGLFVVQRIRIYEKYDSAVANVPPFRCQIPLFGGSEVRNQVKMMREKYRIEYGEIKSKTLIYLNRSRYDTRMFKSILERGDVDEED